MVIVRFTMNGFILWVMFSSFSVVQLYDVESQWNEFKHKYQKAYDSSEENNKLQIFADNLKKISRHNALYKTGRESFELGVSQFADLTSEEFEKYYLTNLTERLVPKNVSNVYRALLHDSLPDEVDWRKKGAVNVVRQQGFCGSCYAMTAVGCVEALHFLKTGTMLSLSPQNIVDCSVPNGNHKCKSGSVDRAFSYIRETGIMFEKDYRYAGRTSKCRYDATKNVMNIRGYVWVEENENALKSAVAEIGPIGVSVDAREWQLYKSGILTAKNPYVSPTHAVIVVGYGTENGTDFWLLKNSYGVNFGEEGYIRIGRNMNNQFGISDFGIYPIL